MLRIIISLVFFLLLALPLSAQETGGIWGHITDAELKGEPLIFANVELKGSSTSVQSNFHGNFEFENVEAGNYTLVVNYLGYESLEIPVVVENARITRLDFTMGKMNYQPQTPEMAHLSPQSEAYPVTSGQN